MELMNDTWQEDMRQRIKVAQRLGLDFSDEDVLKLLIPTSLPDLGAGLPKPDKDSRMPPNELIEDLNPNLPVVILETKQPTIIYGDQWIVLQNRLLNAISDLDLNERRLIMFLSPLVRKAVDINSNQRTFVVRVQDFQSEYNLKGNAYYAQLADSCSALVNKAYTFWDFNKNQKKKTKTQVSWLTKAEYQDKLGEVHIDLHNDVVEMLTVFDKANPFTKYERQMIVNLGSYGMILFELIASCMYQAFKKKAYTIEYLREKFNCVDNYLTPTDFKRYVLDRAIKDIHKHTPYRITYTQNKKGRVVTEIVFSFEDTTEKRLTGSGKKAISHKKEGEGRDPNNGDLFTIDGLTDKQLGRVVHSIKFIADYGYMVTAQNPANQSSSAWISHMIAWLKKEPSKFTKRPMQEYLGDIQADRF